MIDGLRGVSDVTLIGNATRDAGIRPVAVLPEVLPAAVDQVVGDLYVVKRERYKS